MRTFKIVSAAAAIVALSAFMPHAPLAPHDPCKVLSGEKFSKIVGYTANIDKTASTATTCYYQGGKDGAGKNEGGQFMIMSETADPARADAMINRGGRGSAPPAGSGLIGGMYREGSILFSVSFRGTDQEKLKALVAEIRRGLS